jgi:hypothetical protein
MLETTGYAGVDNKAQPSKAVQPTTNSVIPA